MSLNADLSIAAGSLANINAQLDVISNNVANAGTADYTVETGNQRSLVAGSQAMGVQTLATSRAVDQALRQSAFQQDSTVAGLTTTTTSLNAIDALQGTPGQGNDLGSLLEAVQTGFSTLLNDPSNAAQQSAVVSAASNLTNAINTLSDGYTQQRQAAQTDIVSAVSSLNGDLSQIGSLNNQIINLRGAGQSTASLESQRDALVHTISNIVGIKTLNQPNGDMVITTQTGTLLSTLPGANPLSTSDATIGPEGTAANGGIPAITLGGLDVTKQLQGGQLGADITLRDSTLPTFQGELDEFANTLASRFSAQGLNLFTDPTGNIPAGGGTPVQSSYVGFASEIQVNPQVIATPSLIRDGTQDVPGSPTGASAFNVNPSGGPAGFTALINRILNYALGSDAQNGVAQTASNTSGLGPDGTLNAPYAAPSTLADNATAVISAQAAVSAAATGQLTTEQTVQTTINNNLTAASGVNMDTQMSYMIQLENAYGVNAKIIGAVQSMFSTLLQAVQ